MGMLTPFSAKSIFSTKKKKKKKKKYIATLVFMLEIFFFLVNWLNFFVGPWKKKKIKLDMSYLDPNL